MSHAMITCTECGFAFHASTCPACEERLIRGARESGIDAVKEPTHYKSNGMEVIDIIEAFGLGFRLGNVVKYILRSDKKGNSIEDLKKARRYLSREIAILEGRKAWE